MVSEAGASHKRSLREFARTAQISDGGLARPIDDLPDVRRLEAMLTPEQTTQLKERLQADLARLADHAHSALDFTMDRDRDRIGRDSMDEATEEETYSTQLRLHDRETFLLGKIREAMARLEKGEIDECEECSEPIGFKRLLARPVTTLCFECKTAREQVESDEGSE
jgi:DnaK suppressor protein